MVVDARGQPLSPCSAEKALRLLQAGRATLLSRDPLTIQLGREVELPAPHGGNVEPLEGRRLLLHICCGPCATYTVKRLQKEGAQVTGHWFNPNIHPFGEHERRRETLAQYGRDVGLPVLWEPGYEMPAFFRMVGGHERFRERCRLCYRQRLERTAQRAAERGMDLFTTTLLISPYQDQRAIREIGEELGARYGLSFYFQNFRRGFAEPQHMAREHGLYMQRYCGCIYSEWEALDRKASTHVRRSREEQAGKAAGECPHP